MKILVFSDTHLTAVFDEKKYRFLRKIIGQADQVIINGDFWDGFITSFDKFINSPWQQLFPLLKEKKAIYIYGNHDHARFADDRVTLFSVFQTQKYAFSTKTASYLLEHGHTSFTLMNGIPPRIVSVITHFSHSIEWFLTKLLGRSTRFFGRRLNRRLKKRARKYGSHTSIFGHTHYAEYDAKNNFINTGYIKHGLAQYLLIDDDRIEAKEEKYS